jgi:ribosomal protein S27AE/N-acetylglutamate synthase-like GNAT family acetyltransferase
MEIRTAKSEDQERISEIAHDSFRSSYSLSPQEIETILEEFSGMALVERLDDPNNMLLVAEHSVEETHEVQGFIDVSVNTDGTIRWLHVDPDARGEGIATGLIERIREEVGEKPLTATVLEDAVEGGEFLEEFGLHEAGNDEIAISGEKFQVTLFTEGETTSDSNEPTVAVPDSVSADGVERPLDRDERIPGKDAPFFPIHSDTEMETQFGYFCSECGSTDVTADGLDRLECGKCGNAHRADKWDDAYL